MVRATKLARRSTSLGRIEALLAQRTKWLRRRTIAVNQLDAVESLIRELGQQLATDRFASDLEKNST